MSASVRTVNQNAYNFIQSIVTKFDQTYFPGVKAPPFILDSKKDGVKMPHSVLIKLDMRNINSWYYQDTLQTSIIAGRTLRKNIATRLPPEIVGIIASNADNFSQWAAILGLTDPKVKMPQATLDYCATAFLKKINIPRNNQSSFDQLKTYVFENAFGHFSQDEQLELINKMKNCRITESYSFKIKFLIFRMQSVVARIFANPYRGYAEYVREIIPLPMTIPSKILLDSWGVFFQMFNRVLTVQNQLSDLSKKGSDQTKNKVIIEEAPKAYQLWTHLMENPANLYMNRLQTADV